MHAAVCAPVVCCVCADATAPKKFETDEGVTVMRTFEEQGAGRNMTSVPPTPSTHAVLSGSADASEDCVWRDFEVGADGPPRPHQVECVNRVCSALEADCAAPTPSNYLIQHAAGSGKSLTIAALACALTRLVDRRGNRFRLVVIISDRKTLDDQLGGVLETYFRRLGLCHQLERAESCQHLRGLLADDGGKVRHKSHGRRQCRVIVTTFQKARGQDSGGGGADSRSVHEGDEGEEGDHVDETSTAEGTMDDGAAAAIGTATTANAAVDHRGACSRSRIALLADEAHRSHGHGTTAALHELLSGRTGQQRHVAYVSFTATPSEVALRLFGVTDHTTGSRQPFHCFPLLQAIASGFCVDVLGRYTTAKPAVQISDAKGRPKSLDDVLSASTSKRASARQLQRAAAARGAVVEAKAAGALRFVLSSLAGALAAGMEDPKAMMVVRSRQHCADYREAILRLVDAGDGADEACGAVAASQLRVYVAFSGSLSGGAVTEASLNGSSDVVGAFRAPGPALLIVCSKLETGFDEPRITAMVIDRTLRGAHAVQVLGRANRVCARKPPVQVLDFANSAADIAAAFRGFLGATRRSMDDGERRLGRGRELAYISRRLLEMIADRSVASVAATAISTDSAAPLSADLEEYLKGCDALGEEVVELPCGYASRLLDELRAAAASSPSEASRRGAAATAAAAAPDAAAAAGRGGHPSDQDVGASGGVADGGTLSGGYTLKVGGVTETFSGCIPLEEAGASSSAPLVVAPRTRPVTSVGDLHLAGEAGADVRLQTAVETATALAERAVRAMIAAPPTPGATGGAAAMSTDELRAADQRLKQVVRGGAAPGEAQSLLLQLLHRPPPTVQALKQTKAGMTLKAIAKASALAGPVAIGALAAALLGKWKAAVDAEERRMARAAALKLGGVSAKEPEESGATSKAGNPAGAVDHISELDPVRQTAACHIAEALKAGDATSADGELAARIEAALFDSHGRETGKMYRSRARALCSSLRSVRGGVLRKRLRDGELSASSFCKLDANDLGEALLTEVERRERKRRKELEQRAIESLKIDNQGVTSDAYKCESCGGRRCTQYQTQSMGAVHLTAVPDMILSCLDCNHSWTI